ncbi:MAG: putative secreted protein [Microbacterium sp.]|nr:putative secreted protein [Microbacterium sp.]
MKITPALSAAALLVVIAGSMSAPAYANEDPQPVPPEQITESNVVVPLDATILIDGKPTDIAVMPDFDPEAPAMVFGDSGEPVPVESIEVVYADGQRAEVSAVSPTNRAAVASCTRGWAAPGTGTWYYSVLGCSHIGFTATATVGYKWTVDGNSNGSACFQGRGYHLYSYPGGSTYKEIYSGLGCGGSGSDGGGSILWGNVASSKRIKMMSTASPVGAAGTFE